MMETKEDNYNVSTICTFNIRNKVCDVTRKYIYKRIRVYEKSCHHKEFKTFKFQL